jgi:hypothetical protein
MQQKGLGTTYLQFFTGSHSWGRYFAKIWRSPPRLKGFCEKAFGDDRYDTRREGRKHLEDTERVKRGEDDDQALNIDWVQQT